MMPRYDYRCTACQNEFEAVHAIDAAPPQCPACSGPAQRAFLSAPAVHGFMARGRQRASNSLPECGKGCRCCP